jgi:hypothetical protein
MDGQTDYLLYNPSSQNELRLSNGISMSGKIGYLQEKNGQVNKGVLLNGSALKFGKMDLKSAGEITGKIVKMNKEADGNGWVLVDTKLPLDASLHGRQIIIETDTERDASYTISYVEKQGDLTKIFCGPISFIRGFKGGTMVVRTATVPKTYKEGYLYDFEEGASFKITSHAVWTSRTSDDK